MPSEGSTVSHTPTPADYWPDELKLRVARLLDPENREGRLWAYREGHRIVIRSREGIVGDLLVEGPFVNVATLAANATLATDIVSRVNALEGWEDPADVGEVVEAVGLAIDTAENGLAAASLPVRAEIHVEGLKAVISEICDNLRAALERAPK